MLLSQKIFGLVWLIFVVYVLAYSVLSLGPRSDQVKLRSYFSGFSRKPKYFNSNSEFLDEHVNLSVPVARCDCVQVITVIRSIKYLQPNRWIVVVAYIRGKRHDNTFCLVLITLIFNYTSSCFYAEYKPIYYILSLIRP